MPRPPRIAVPGIALHVVQRGNNRQAVFFHESDYEAYLDRLFESAERYEVSVHAYVCMTNHVHLLVTLNIGVRALFGRGFGVISFA